MAALVIDTADSAEQPGSPIIETNIPARLERLLWGRFHTLVVIALGITWILDGLEVTLAGVLAALKQSSQLHFSNATKNGWSLISTRRCAHQTKIGLRATRSLRKRSIFCAPVMSIAL
jgi:hypothetical protein